MKAEWTTEYPTKPGYYWLRNYQIVGWLSHPGAAPEVVLVDPKLEFDRIGDDRGYHRRDFISGEWRGPIQPPENL